MAKKKNSGNTDKEERIIICRSSAKQTEQGSEGKEKFDTERKQHWSSRQREQDWCVCVCVCVWCVRACGVCVRACVCACAQRRRRVKVHGYAGGTFALISQSLSRKPISNFFSKG